MPKVRVAFNAYVASANNANYAPLQIGLRKKNSNEEATLVGLRANGYLQYGGGSTYQTTYTKGKWYYFVCDIDTAAKTYTCLLYTSYSAV